MDLQIILKSMSNLQDIARNRATAEIFQTMASEQKSKEVIDQIRSMSDAKLDMMATLSGIPKEDREIHKSLMRGEESHFMQQFQTFNDRLDTGDIILMTGTSHGSNLLAKSQKTFYLNARSSHIAIVHADFICIDAIPNPGVSNRLISEVLSDVEDNWRVIRFNKIEEKQT